MTHIEDVLLFAISEKGVRYVFGAEASVREDHPGRIDCCLVAGTLITTARGAIPIEEVASGDLTATWDAGALSWRKVIAAEPQTEQPVFKVRTRSRALVGSSNHPVLRLVRGDRPRIGVEVSWGVEWARIDELQRGDLIVTSEHYDITSGEPHALDDGTPIDADVAWLVGLALGDGHVSHGGLNVCVYGATADRAATIIERTWHCSTRRTASHGVISPKATSAAFLPLLAKSHLKQVPAWVWKSPAHLVRSFLAGYAAADGHHDKRGHVAYHSSSRRLVAEARALHLMLGDRVSNITTTERRHPITIKGKLVKNALPLHSVTWYPDSVRRNQTMLDTYGARRALPDRRFGAERVLTVESAGEAMTYDLEIEGTHNYVADGIVVHNSELVEWSCGKAGVQPTVPDGSYNQFAHCQRNNTVLSVDRALHTRGALMFITEKNGVIGHVACSLGDGTTMEAKGAAYGVGTFTAYRSDGRLRFDKAGLIPGVDYFSPRKQLPPPPEDQMAATKTVKVTCAAKTGHGQAPVPGVHRETVLSASCLAGRDGSVAKVGIHPDLSIDGFAQVCADVGGPTPIPVEVTCFVAFNP